MKIASAVSTVMLAWSVSFAHAQEPEEAERKNVFGIFTGALSNLETGESGPAIGVDYTRAVHERLGIVVQVEWAEAGEREAAFGGGVQLKPGGNFKLLFAPGVIFETSEDDSESEDSGGGSRETLFVFRAGIGYELEVSGVTLVPSFNFDVVESEDGVDAHLVYGVTVELPF